jgi:hypothetical protein
MKAAPTLLDVLVAQVATLDGDELDCLFDRLSPLLNRVGDRRAARAVAQSKQGEGWLNAREAAAYVGLTLNALHKHTAARTIPFEQDGPGCKLWFRRSELDRWRRGDRRASA